MTIRILHAADVHLDSPFALGPNSRAPHDATFEAFTKVVTTALREKVDAVVLSGDLYERRDRSVRARFHLQRELERLHDAQIPSFIVHGNHDPLSGDPGGVRLPPSATVFGAALNEVCVSRQGAVRFRVQGVSYQEAQVHENLARGFRRQGPEVTVGLLHCNVGGVGAHADYAPCTTDDLDAAGLDYWALGHVHTRQTMPLHGGGVAAYPGNTQGRQINESGARGCLLVDLDEARQRPPTVQFIACDVVRWHRLEVEVSNLTTLDAALEQLDRQVEEAIALTTVSHHVVRVVLTGRTTLHRQFTATALSEFEQTIIERWATRPLSLESLRASTMAPLDLPRLVASGGLPGEIAKLMVEPMSPAARTRVWENAGLSSLQAQLKAAHLELSAPQLLEQALVRALELVTGEEEA